MRAYLRLRGRVIGRQLWEMGWVRLVLLGSMGGLTWGRVGMLLQQHPPLQWLAAVVCVGMAWSGHRQRTDVTFLALASPQYRRWLSVEYALLLVPGWGLLAALGYGAGAGLTLGGAAVVGFLPVASRGEASKTHRSWLRSEAFEWVSGFRQTQAGIWWLLGLGLALWQHATVVPAVVLAAWSVLVAFFYATPEPVEMVTIYSRGARAFRRRKLGWAAALYLLTAAPFAGLMAGGSAGVGGALGLLIWGLLTISMSVLAKYTFYPQPTLVRLTQGATVALAIVPLLDSSCAPLPVAVGLGLLWKSHQRLQHYWHA